ncbi:stAR-related lipid transfer protein 13 isoform X3 [Silurus asotus]|uniref:StAR-related lipid transfer protein 13 isoform X3 n=1 Tax=Silurus asotus TaxID=30991 RepID=A0AAD5FEY6_SILAS|nr:stAR-related lipid transfer protein 13 isoform X3 [Silurus asotus]
MTTRRKSTKLQLRRSISEQLRDSTSKAWDLLWKNVRERRLAGQYNSSSSSTSYFQPFLRSYSELSDAETEHEHHSAQSSAE